MNNLSWGIPFKLGELSNLMYLTTCKKSVLNKNCNFDDTVIFGSL